MWLTDFQSFFDKNIGIPIKSMIYPLTVHKSPDKDVQVKIIDISPLMNRSIELTPGWYIICYNGYLSNRFIKVKETVSLILNPLKSSDVFYSLFVYTLDKNNLLRFRCSINSDI